MIGAIEQTTENRAARRATHRDVDSLELRNYEHDDFAYFNAHVLARTGERFRPLDFVDGHTILIDRELMERRRENRRRVAGRVGERSMTSRTARAA
jgi:hypothetical protein